MKLTDTQIRKAKPGERDIKLTDGHGLYLLVTSRGTKLWRWRYEIDGKERVMALGSYPEIGLQKARDLHHEARKLLRSGTDPMAKRKSEKNQNRAARENSFKSVAETWFERWSVGKNEKNKDSVWRRIETDIFPAIGHLPVSKIEATDVVAVVKSISERGAIEMARRALGRMREIFSEAIVLGLAKRNPAADIKPGHLLPSIETTNYARIEADQMPSLLRKIDLYQGSPVTRLAMKLMAHTFVRTGELIGARWSEFNFTAKRWTIPEERMKRVKNTTPHIVPLSKQVIQLLEDLQSLTGNGEFLFPSERHGTDTMSNNTILKALERMGYRGDMTGHGFRGLATTVISEEWNTTDPLKDKFIDLQLAHLHRNKVRAAYDHSKHLKQRAEMLQWWSDWIERSKNTKASSRSLQVA